MYNKCSRAKSKIDLIAKYFGVDHLLNFFRYCYLIPMTLNGIKVALK